jgi:ABC-type uncharacterized transport system substrate-binding protein
LANPYIWVTAKGTIDYSDIGVPTAIRYAWRFDKGFSGFAAAGVDTDGDGKTSPAELAAAATINVKALASHGYFTHVSAGTHTLTTGPARDYALSNDDGVLTLRFTLPLAHAPASEIDPLHVKLYDPSYFIAFALAPGNAIKLAGAPPACVAALTRRHQPMDHGNLTTKLDLKGQPGLRYADTATVACAGQALAFAAAMPGPTPSFPPVSGASKPPPTAANAALRALASPRAPAPPPAKAHDDPAARITAALEMAAQRPLHAYVPPAHPVVTAAAARIKPVTVETVTAHHPAPARTEPAAVGVSIPSEQLLLGLGILGLGAALFGSLLLRGSLMR